MKIRWRPSATLVLLNMPTAVAAQIDRGRVRRRRLDMRQRHPLSCGRPIDPARNVRYTRSNESLHPCCPLPMAPDRRARNHQLRRWLRGSSWSWGRAKHARGRKPSAQQLRGSLRLPRQRVPRLSLRARLRDRVRRCDLDPGALGFHLPSEGVRSCPCGPRTLRERKWPKGVPLIQ
jgi:hypothetical protein